MDIAFSALKCRQVISLRLLPQARRVRAAAPPNPKQSRPPTGAARTASAAAAESARTRFSPLQIGAPIQSHWNLRCFY